MRGKTVEEEGVIKSGAGFGAGQGRGRRRQRSVMHREKHMTVYFFSEGGGGHVVAVFRHGTGPCSACSTQKQEPSQGS